MTRSVVQLGGQALKLDADGDTTIQVSSDDVLIVDTAGNEALKIDANGHITKALQSCFFAKKNSDTTNVAVNSAVAVVFDSEIFDQNADFDTSNGTFTAPITGRYYLSASLYVGGMPNDATTVLWKLFVLIETTWIFLEVKQVMKSGYTIALKWLPLWIWMQGIQQK